MILTYSTHISLPAKTETLVPIRIHPPDTPQLSLRLWLFRSENERSVQRRNLKFKWLKLIPAHSWGGSKFETINLFFFSLVRSCSEINARCVVARRSITTQRAFRSRQLSATHLATIVKARWRDDALARTSFFEGKKLIFGEAGLCGVRSLRYHFKFHVAAALWCDLLMKITDTQGAGLCGVEQLAP